LLFYNGERVPLNGYNDEDPREGEKDAVASGAGTALVVGGNPTASTTGHFPALHDNPASLRGYRKLPACLAFTPPSVYLFIRRGVTFA